MSGGADGLLAGARQVASPNCDERPADSVVSLLVLHAISLPPGKFGSDAIERLFTNRLDPQAHPYFRTLAGLRVSSHLLIRRDGSVIQFVPLALRAWHAGESIWRGRTRCNDFSVGVELEGCDEQQFDPRQYASLGHCVRELRSMLPLAAVAGHQDIAPARKTDPGPQFDWRASLRVCLRAH